MRFKVGDTFDLSGLVEVIDAAGVPVSLIGWTVSCKIRFKNSKKLVTIGATWLNAPTNTLLRLFLADTNNWVAGPAEIDVKFVSPGGNEVSTETKAITIVEAVSGA